MSNTISNPASLSQTDRVTILGVPRKPVLAEDVGLFFRELRENRKLKLRQVVRIAEDRKPPLSVVTINTLGSIERGETKHADPELLQALATLYRIPYTELVAGYVGRKYGVPPVAEVQHENNGAIVTQPVPADRLSSDFRVRDSYAVAPRGTTDVEAAAPIRSPIDLASRLEQQAADIRATADASADALVAIADAITRQFGDDSFGDPGATAGLDPRHPQTHPTAAARPPRRRRGGQR